MKNKVVILILLILNSAACVTVTSDYDALKADVNMLKKDVYETKVAIEDLNKKLREISEIMKAGGTEQAKAITESQVMLFNKLSSLSSELSELRARFEEQRNFVDKLVAELKQSDEAAKIKMENLELTMKDLQVRLENVEKQLRSFGETPKGSSQPFQPQGEPQPQLPKKSEDYRGTPPAQPTQPDSVAMAPAPEERGSDEPKLLYDRARELFKKNKYKEARELFEEFIKKYPTYRLAGNCRFWIAETYFAEKNYEDAILNYEKVIKEYPSNEKVPAAYLKQAYAFIELGDKKTGKVILERLIQKYPASEETKTARRKLAELTQDNKKKKK